MVDLKNHKNLSYTPKVFVEQFITQIKLTATLLFF